MGEQESSVERRGEKQRKGLTRQENFGGWSRSKGWQLPQKGTYHWGVKGSREERGEEQEPEEGGSSPALCAPRLEVCQNEGDG
jgi:hypothetical protein